MVLDHIFIKVFRYLVNILRMHFLNYSYTFSLLKIANSGVFIHLFYENGRINRNCLKLFLNAYESISHVRKSIPQRRGLS